MAPPRRVAENEAYAGRHIDTRVFNTALDREVVEVLRKYCPPGRRMTGKFIGRLILEHDVRVQERQKLEAELAHTRGSALVRREFDRRAERL